MNQIVCLEKPGDLQKICKKQLEKNSSYIQDYIKVMNELTNSTSQLLLDFQTQNNIFQEKIREYNDDEKGQQDLNILKEILNDYLISDLPSLNQMENLQNEFLKTIKEIHNKHFSCKEQVQVFNFMSGSTVLESFRFKDFQESNYVQSEKIINNSYEVNAAEISPDETLLVTISRNFIFLWDYLNQTLRQEFSIDTQIITFTFIYPSNGIVFGDMKGRIHQIFVSDQIQALTNVFQAHQDEIYYIQIKQNDEIFTCSKDNTIKLINTSQNQILQTIQYLCPCQSNFVYNEMEKVLIAPNGKNISIYNSNNGKQLFETHYGDEKMILSMLLSHDCTDLYLNLFSKCLINIYLMDCSTKQIVLSKIIQLYTFCYNLSLCFNDHVLIILNDGGFEFRYLEDDLILIKEIQAIGTERQIILITFQILLQQVTSKIKQTYELE
ncbi:hypothetical protein pb186bvf_020434 [Paramecium bursaria]